MVEQAPERAGARRARVVVVDDEPSVVALVRTVLQIDGHDVYEALNGPIGLATVEAVLPSVVVLDVMMPGMDGVEVCRHIYTDHPGVQVLVLTGSADPELAERCREAGAAAFMAKPFEPEQLSAAVRALAAAAEL
ncbi:MAG TPA: response regulator [Acidimicrobiales bacterium]|nr:response regulator [Acidimicrobiales bacterium]